MFGVIAAAIFAYLGVLVFILEGWAVLEAVCPKPTGVVLNQTSTTLKRILKRCPTFTQRKRFRPTFWLASPHLQTWWASRDHTAPTVLYRRLLITTTDGGTSAVDFAVAVDGKRYPFLQDGAETGNTPLLLLVPSLTGDSETTAIRHMVAAGVRQGWRVGVVNHRGVAGVEMTSPQTCSAGFTGDLRTAVAVVRAAYAGQPLMLGGLSMGGNIVCKYLAEEGAECPAVAAFTLSNPYDLSACDYHMRTAYLNRLVYTTKMAKELKQKTAQLKVFDEKIDMEGVNKSTSVRDFDKNFTAPLFGYETTNEYYRDASCGPRLPQVMVPTLCLSAQDDPIVPTTAWPEEEVLKSSHIVFMTSPRGGHISFYTGLVPRVWWTTPVTEFLSSTLALYLQNKGIRE